MADTGKTQSERMDLLPEVAEIRIHWQLDECLLGPMGGFTLIGHGGAKLADVVNTEKARGDGPVLDRLITADLPLVERLPLVAMVLNLVGAYVLDERDGSR